MNYTATSDSKEKRINRDRGIVVVKQNHKNFIRISILNLFKPKNKIIFKEEIEKMKVETLKTPGQGIVAALEGIKIGKDRTKILKLPDFNKLMIIGKHDPILDRNTLMRQAKNADVDIVEFSGRDMNYIENRSAYLKVFVHFVEKT